jgi:hypothetical protein
MTIKVDRTHRRRRNRRKINPILLDLKDAQEKTGGNIIGSES